MQIDIEDSILVSNIKLEYHTSDDLFMRGKIQVSLNY